MKMKKLKEKKIKAYQVEKNDIIIVGNRKYRVKSSQPSYQRISVQMHDVNEEFCYDTTVSLILPPLARVNVWQPK